MKDPIFKNRIQLVHYFAKLGFKTGVEIGVFEGKFAQQLCENIPGLKYFGIDSWPDNNNPNKYPHYGLKQKAQANLTQFPQVTLIHQPSLQAVQKFVDSSLDFVYIDGDHQFDQVVQDIIHWTKKVKKGGIVSGHDYRLGPRVGVIPAVDGYTKSHSLALNVTLDSKFEAPSWWFVKRWNT